jgi:hypothetical protein
MEDGRSRIQIDYFLKVSYKTQPFREVKSRLFAACFLSYLHSGATSTKTVVTTVVVVERKVFLF